MSDKFYPREITIDGQPVAIRVARLTIDQEHDVSMFMRSNQQRAIRNQRLRQQALDDPDKFEAAIVQEGKDELAARKGFAAFVTDYLRFEPGACKDGEDPVETGAEIVATFGGSKLVIQQLMDALLVANRITPDEKKASSSPSPSAPGSASSTPVPVHGDAPAPTAESASR